MKAVLNRLKLPAGYLGRKKLAFKQNLQQQMLVVKVALKEESAETKVMLKTYRKYTQGQANKDEMKIANAQFVDLVKGLGIGVFAILPFSPITIPLAIKLGRRVGVEILPSSFSKPNMTNNNKD